MKRNISSQLKLAYNNASNDYNSSRYGFPGGRLFKDFSNQIAVDILTELSSRSSNDLVVLDFATGTGKLAFAIREIPGISRVVGLDISRGMLSQATSSPDNNEGGILWVNGNGLRLPFDDCTFDHIISFKFLHIMENTHHYNFLVELHRVLKPGGRLIIDCSNGIFGIFISIKRLKRWRNNARFYWPHHRYTLYRDFSIVEIIGEWFPFTGLWYRISPFLSDSINRIARETPLKYLCGKLILVFERTAI